MPTPKYYALKAKDSDLNCFAVVCEKLTHERTMEAIQFALTDEFEAEFPTPNIDLADVCSYGSTGIFTTTSLDGDTAVEIEIQETWLY